MSATLTPEAPRNLTVLVIAVVRHELARGVGIWLMPSTTDETEASLLARFGQDADESGQPVVTAYAIGEIAGFPEIAARYSMMTGGMMREYEA